MADPINDSGATGGLPSPPELPRGLLDLRKPVLVGIVLWFAAFVVLLATGTNGTWLWTTLTGGVLGVLGFGIMAWQRTASRRGTRGAQRNL